MGNYKVGTMYLLIWRKMLLLIIQICEHFQLQIQRRLILLHISNYDHIFIIF